MYSTVYYVLDSRGELPLDPADVLLLDLASPDLLLHLSRLLGIAPEEEEARGEPVQPVDRPQVLQALLLRKDEHHRVVTVTPAGVNLKED